jgi:hypothetical protein
MLAVSAAATILFPTGNARLSTIVAVAAFVALALSRRSWSPVAACAAWLFGFEAAFDVTGLAAGRPAALDVIHLTVYLVLAVALPLWLARRGVLPSWRLLGAALAIWLVWVATGFHVNEHSMVDFDPVAEVWNEGAKTLWAAAYFLPLWKALTGVAPALAPPLEPPVSPPRASAPRRHS